MFDSFFQSETATFQAVLLSDYLTTYYVTLYQDGEMKWNVPMSSVPGSTDYYVSRVGMFCGASNKYTYDYSQLPYAQISNKPKTEKISNVFQSYTGFSTSASTLLLKRQTSGAVTYSNNADDSAVPAYSKRGIFVYVLNVAPSHPVMECKTWLGSATPISNASFAEVCPAAKSQMIVSAAMTVSTTGDYEFYFIPLSSGSVEGINCGYLNSGSEDDGSLIAADIHKSVNGSNLYRYVCKLFILKYTVCETITINC